MAAYGIRVKGNSPWSLGGKGGMDYRDDYSGLYTD